MQNFDFDIAARLEHINASKKPIDKFEIVRRDVMGAINGKMSLFDLAETVLAIGSQDQEAVHCLRQISIGDVLQGTVRAQAPRKSPTKTVSADPAVVDSIVEALRNGPISQTDVRQLLANIDEAQFRAAWNAAKPRMEKTGAGRATMWCLTEDSQSASGMKRAS